ncbi:MAG TPA: class I SAM-dependent methyltransferase [Phenylobacterium sp.]|nr:class I SAM-dependent methyltransferase [Phenylobacterium sp.]
MTADLDRYRRLDAFLEGLRGDVYPEPPSELHTELTRRMFQHLARLHPFPPGAAVLDVGCGQGVALEMFKAAGLDPVGVTLGPDVEICRAKGLDVLEMDFSFLDFEDGRFDLVWCRHALEHSVLPFFTLHEMRRVLKPGGVLYVEAPAPDTACRHQTNPNHYSVLGKSMWIELIGRAGFERLVATDINFTTAAGPDTYWGFIQTKPV